MIVKDGEGNGRSEMEIHTNENDDVNQSLDVFLAHSEILLIPEILQVRDNPPVGHTSRDWNLEWETVGESVELLQICLG
jgi:hypothetical protein